MTHTDSTLLLIAVLREIGTKIEVSFESLEWASGEGAVTAWEQDGSLFARADVRPGADA